MCRPLSKCGCLPPWQLRMASGSNSRKGNVLCPASERLLVRASAALMGDCAYEGIWKTLYTSAAARYQSYRVRLMSMNHMSDNLRDLYTASPVSCHHCCCSLCSHPFFSSPFLQGVYSIAVPLCFLACYASKTILCSLAISYSHGYNLLSKLSCPHELSGQI